MDPVATEGLPQIHRGIRLGWVEPELASSLVGTPQLREDWIAGRLVLPLGAAWSQRRAVAVEFATGWSPRPFNRKYANRFADRCLIGVLVSVPVNALSDAEQEEAAGRGRAAVQANVRTWGYGFPEEAEFNVGRRHVWPISSAALYITGGHIGPAHVDATSAFDGGEDRFVSPRHDLHDHRNGLSFDGRCTSCGHQDVIDAFGRGAHSRCPICGGSVESGHGTAWGDTWSNRWPAAR